MEKIAFELFGMDLLEPMSLVTNWIITITCLVFVFKLRKENDSFSQFWTLFFLIFALSTFTGGLSHVFFNYTGQYGKLIPFSLAIISNYFLEKGTYVFDQNYKKKEFFEWFSLSKLIVSLILLGATLHFQVVTINTSVTVLLILARFINSIRKLGNAYKLYSYGAFVLMITGLVQALKINLHLWFNKDDFSHILIAIAMIYFFKATVRLKNYKKSITV